MKYLVLALVASLALTTSPAHAADMVCGPAAGIVKTITDSKFLPFAQFQSSNDGDLVTIFRDTEGHVIVTGTFLAQNKACIYDGGKGLKLALPEYGKADKLADPAVIGQPM